MGFAPAHRQSFDEIVAQLILFRNYCVQGRHTPKASEYSAPMIP
jgi:hypothetical protein